MNNQQKAHVMAYKIEQQALKSAGKGLNAARVFLTARVREALSVPAPRTKVMKTDGSFYYRATKPAKKDEPPRKLSGRGRMSVTSSMISPTEAVVGTNVVSPPTKRYPGGFRYLQHHEVKQAGRPTSGLHKFLEPTVLKYQVQLAIIIGRAVVIQRM